MATVAGLGDMIGKGTGPLDGGINMPLKDKSGGIGGIGGGGGSATDGLGQIDSGAGTVRSALSTAANALGGGDRPSFQTFKKGGYVSKGGKLNLGSNRVSTTSKNKSNSNW